MGEGLYLIWSMEHGAWWAPGRMGYSETVVGAGRYTRDEARAIVEDANVFSTQCHEAMIPCSAVMMPEDFRLLDTLAHNPRLRTAIIEIIGAQPTTLTEDGFTE